MLASAENSALQKVLKCSGMTSAADMAIKVDKNKSIFKKAVSESSSTLDQSVVF